jgi:hypothetical protein
MDGEAHYVSGQVWFPPGVQLTNIYFRLLSLWGQATGSSFA